MKLLPLQTRQKLKAAATKAAKDLTSAQTVYDQTAAVYQSKLN